MNKDQKEVLLFCALPLVVSVLAIFVAQLLSSFIFVLGAVNIVWFSTGLAVVSALLGCTALASFSAHFNPSIDRRISWATVLITGLLNLLFFAILHSSAGMDCAAADCSNANVVREGVNGLSRYYDLGTGLYFSAVTLTTLGYGDVQPVASMRAVAAIQAVFGYTYFGFAVGVVFNGTRAK